MVTNILMIILLISYLLAILFKSRYCSGKNSFFSLQETNVMKGLWCIIVLLVHTPDEYQNRIQDMMGSFAYIGVTFYFMSSSYGLKYGIIYKPDYLNRFWVKRLPKILIPALLINCMQALYLLLYSSTTFSWLTFINIGNWVKVLLLFYFIFWIVYTISYKVIYLRGGVLAGHTYLPDSGNIQFA